MVAALQRKFPLGVSSNDAMDRLNEAFRKIDQMSQGGFVWQLKTAVVTLPPGAQTQVFLPLDFDPGKKAVLQGSTGTPTNTEVPYKPFKDFVNQQHFQTSGSGNFSCWTFIPSFTLTDPTTYKYLFGFAPAEAFPLSAGATFLLFYHAMNFQPFAISATIFFPTPDQFDTLIIDLAEAELQRIYRYSGWEKLAGQVTSAIQQMIDTYRTDRYDLAGMADQAAQAQEKAAERER
jgi:hypothetical protein